MKKNLGKKMFWVKKKMCVQKKFNAIFFGSLIILGTKKFKSKKKFGSKKFEPKKKLGHGKIFDPKKYLGPQNVYGP